MRGVVIALVLAACGGKTKTPATATAPDPGSGSAAQQPAPTATTDETTPEASEDPCAVPPP